VPVAVLVYPQGSSAWYLSCPLLLIYYPRQLSLIVNFTFGKPTKAAPMLGISFFYTFWGHIEIVLVQMMTFMAPRRLTLCVAILPPSKRIHAKP
jgi:hypothetical protein